MTTHSEPLHSRIERTTGAELRLIYGLGVPMLAAVGIIVAALVADAMWLIPVALLAVIGITVVVIAGFSEMLGEDDND
jgi:hypothetical protein